MSWIALEPQPPAPILTVAEFEDSRLDGSPPGLPQAILTGM